MKNIHIKATLPQPIQTATIRFSLSYPKSGSCSLDLTPYGDYLLHVDESNTEGAVRRTAEYKAAYNKVTMAMLHSYEAENRLYTSMHRDMPKVESRESFERKLTSMCPQKYHRKTFAFPMPTKSDVEEDLRKEVMSLNHVDNIINMKEYLCQHLGTLTETRQQAWYEAQKLFDRIEDAREKRENSKFFADFQVAYKKEKELLAGNYDIVEKDMNELCCNISVPYNLVLSYEYLQNKQQISIEVIVEDGINAPNSKAVVLTSGKISIKNKLVRETIQDKSSSALSLAYMVSAHVFNVSPNIEYIRLSLFDRTKQTPLLFVEFNRDVFSHINPKLLALFTDILGYPHVINFKTKGGASEISTWDASHFNQEVMVVCSEKDKERNSVSCEDQEMENGMISISVAQANRLCRFVSDNSDIRHAISLAEDNHADEVVISNKYKGILEEIKNA